MTQNLPNAVDAPRHEFDGRSGRLSYYVAGEGSPLLLVHSINAAGSVYEIKPVFDEFRKTHRVYAVDLPGFGFSERSDRRYDIQLFVDAIFDMLDLVAAKEEQCPVSAMALSLSAEFLARAARDRPDEFETLTFVTPTGFNRGADRMRLPEGTTREVKALTYLLNFGTFSNVLFNNLVRPGSIRYFLRKTFGRSEIDEGLARYADLTTHQPGAKHAPLAFITGRLFSQDIRSIYEALKLPVFLIYGSRGDFSDFREAVWVDDKLNWRRQRLETGAIPYFERPDAFFASFREFLENPPESVQMWQNVSS